MDSYHTFAMAKHISPFLGGRAMCNLVHTCAQMRAQMLDFTTNLRTLISIPTTSNAVEFVASCGREDLCEVLIINQSCHRLLDMDNIFSDLMMAAAGYGSVNLCRLIKRITKRCCPWFTYFGSILLGAIRCHDQVHARELCILAHKWHTKNEIRHPVDTSYAAEKRHRFDVDDMLIEAARANSMEICKLAREWGAVASDSSLRATINHRNRELCSLMRDWLISDSIKLAQPERFPDADFILCQAARSRSVDICYLACEWGAHNFKRMLEQTVTDGDLASCTLAWNLIKEQEKKGVPRIIDEVTEHALLQDAVCFRSLEICRLIRSWFPTTKFNWNELLSGAATTNRIDICRFVRDCAIADSYPLHYGVILEHPCSSQLFKLMHEWALTSPETSRLDYKRILKRALTINNPQMGILAHDCLIAKGIPCPNNSILKYAARFGSREFCELARSWGATNFNIMLFEAMRNRHSAICILAYTWGATNYDDALSLAYMLHSPKLITLATGWMLRSCATSL